MNFTNAIYFGKQGTLTMQSGTKYFIVATEFYFYVDYINKKDKIVVPEGYKTDLGSIPRFLFIFFNPTKFVSYILHDYILDELRDEYTRAEADQILLDGLTVEKANNFEKTCIYCGVRLRSITKETFNLK